MDLAESLAKGIVSRFKSLNVGENAKVERVNPPSILLHGFDFIFSLNGRKLDLLIDPPIGEEEKFLSYFEDISRSFEDTPRNGIFDRPEFEKIKDDMKKSQYFLRSKRFYMNGEGKYHFRCELATQSEEKTVYGLISHVIRPVLMYHKVGK